jgi:outer membrane protein assembly factor BamB
MLFPGVIRTAELYVADASTNVYALDANTGAEVWRHFVGAQVNMLAVNDANLFIAGSGLLRAVSRQTGQTIWTVQTGSLLSGGPLVTDDRVMVVTQSGAVLVYDAATGTVIATVSLPGIVNAAPAVSLEWLFAPSGNAILGYRGAP